jgi:hypothetical protein
MKKTSLLILSVLFSFTLFFPVLSKAQEVTPQTYIKEASDFLTAGNYKEAVNALQSAINGINGLMMGKVVESLPKEINGFTANTEDDNTNSGSLGMMGGGLTVTRTYRKADNTDNYFEISILGNSPMISSVNMLLSNPMFMTSSGGKELRYGTRKGVFKKESGDYEFMMPLTASMITIKGYGFATETDFMNILAKVSFDNIAKSLGE